MSALDAVQAGRLYFTGINAASFVSLKPNIVLLEPVRPPAMMPNGFEAPEIMRNIGGAQCTLFRVAKLPEVISHLASEYVKVEVGDVVIVRNAMLDPVHPNNEALVIDVKHIYGVVV